MDLLIFSRRYRGGPGKATNCPPRRPYRERLRSSLSTLRGRGRAQAAIPRRARVLLTLPTDPRGHEPFLHVDLYSEKSIYDDGVLGVYAIACLGDGGAAGAAAGAASTP